MDFFEKPSQVENQRYGFQLNDKSFGNNIDFSKTLSVTSSSSSKSYENNRRMSMDSMKKPGNCLDIEFSMHPSDGGKDTLRIADQKSSTETNLLNKRESHIKFDNSNKTGKILKETEKNKEVEGLRFGSCKRVAKPLTKVLEVEHSVEKLKEAEKEVAYKGKDTTEHSSDEKESYKTDKDEAQKAENARPEKKFNLRRNFGNAVENEVIKRKANQYSPIANRRAAAMSSCKRKTQLASVEKKECFKMEKKEEDIDHEAIMAEIEKIIEEVDNFPVVDASEVILAENEIRKIEEDLPVMTLRLLKLKIRQLDSINRVLSEDCAEVQEIVGKLFEFEKARVGEC